MSVMGEVAIITKFYFEAVWQNYKNPVAFYKAVVQRQIEIGMVNEDDLTENFKTSSPLRYMLSKKSFYFEILIMIIIPAPVHFDHPLPIIDIETINWVDNGGQYDAQSHKYDTPYHTNDFVLALMYIRFYFLVLAVMMYSPVNERLWGKRICQDA